MWLLTQVLYLKNSVKLHMACVTPSWKDQCIPKGCYTGLPNAQTSRQTKEGTGTPSKRDDEKV